MNDRHLRAIILKLQDRLSDNDRRNLHFFLANDVPRRIRDDPSLSGTLCLMESLIDQDKINEQDFTFLINAFDEIQCLDAVKLLRGTTFFYSIYVLLNLICLEHMTRMSLHGMNGSVQSLSLVMPPLLNQILEDQEEDNYVIQTPLINEETYSSNNNFTINSHNRTINSEMIIDDNQTKILSPEKEKKFLNTSTKIHKCCILSILSLFIQIGLFISVCIWIFQFKIQINQQINHHNNNNITSLHLKYLLLIDDGKVEKLNKSLIDNNKAIEELTEKINFLEDEQKFTQGTACGCAKWCYEHGSSYGVCGNGPTCICRPYLITKDTIGDGCRCSSWCQRRNYTDGICGDGYTCICSK